MVSRFEPLCALRGVARKSPQNLAKVTATLAALLAGALIPAACNSETGEVTTLPPGVTSCTVDTQCPGGQYCGGGTCRRDCGGSGQTCSAGMTCTAQGRCVMEMGAGGTSGAGGGGSGATGGSLAGPVIPPPMDGGSDATVDADACASSSVDFTSEIPHVLLLVDRSGSMAGAVMGGTSRWEAVRTALVDPTTGLVPLVQAQVNLGLALYTGPDRGSIGNEDTVGMEDPDFVETEVCPYLVQVPIALNNYTPIDTAYRPLVIRNNSLGQTPTGESIEASLPALTGLDPIAFPGRKVLVLATDGEPDLCADGDDEDGGRMRSVEAVQAAFDLGVTTYIISVGNEVGEEHLHELANLGQGFPADDPMDRFYRANDAMSLAQAFEDIVNGVRDCVFALDGVVKGTGEDGTVTVDGMPLTFNDPNGWRLSDPSTVELTGAACELVKMGNHEIDIAFPCGFVVPK
jgi:hypothetical protein